MKKNSFNIKFLLFSLIFLNFQTTIYSEIMHLKGCKTLKHSFIKNEYILDFEKSLMTRNFVYDNKTYKKLKLTDLSIKKSNSYVRNIYEENGKILTHKHGYPQFYTQILFEKGNQEIYIKTVLNDEEGISKISTCKKIEKFDNES